MFLALLRNTASKEDKEDFRLARGSSLALRLKASGTSHERQARDGALNITVKVSGRRSVYENQDHSFTLARCAQSQAAPERDREKVVCRGKLNAALI